MTHHSIHLLRLAHFFHHVTEQTGLGVSAVGIHRIVVFLHARASLRLNRSRHRAAEADELWVQFLPCYVRLWAENAVHTLMHACIDGRLGRDVLRRAYAADPDRLLAVIFVLHIQFA